MKFSRVTVLPLAALILSACVSEGVSRKDANREQVEAFLTLQSKQNRIQEFALSFPAVEAAVAYVRSDTVIVKMHLREGRILRPAEQARLNRFIEETTGIPRARITLAVPESALNTHREE